MARPKVQSLSSILASLAPAYAPQQQIYQKQIKMLPGEKQGALGGLDAAKLNEFRDIRETAVGSGNIWSGAPLEEQQRYLGEKYLPGVAQVESDYVQKGMALAQAIASLRGEQRLKGLDIQGGQRDTLNAYLEAERDRQFRARQAELDRQADMRLASMSGSGSGSEGVDISLKKNKNGGWVVLENGAPSRNYDLAQAAALMGKDLISLLANGDAQDRQAASWFNDNKNKIDTDDPESAVRALRYAKDQLRKDRSSAFYLGGSF